MAALTKNTRSLCQKLASDFDGVIGPAKAAKSLINATTNQLKGKLNALPGTPTPGLDDALDDFKDDVADNLPGDSLDDLQELKDFIDNCEYLSPLSPVSAVLGSIIGIFNTIEDLIDDLDLSFPEFGAGKLGSLIDKILDGINIPGGDNITNLLKKAEQLLACLEDSCGPEFSGVFTEKSDELTDLLDDLGVVNDPNDPDYGTFDYTKLYNDVGLSASQVEAMNKVKNGINGQKDISSAAVDSTVSAFKNAIKGGLF